MKKSALSLFLAFALVFSMAVPALAAERTASSGSNGQVVLKWNDDVKEVKLGSSVTFNVDGSTGKTTSLYYQWSKDGTNLGSRTQNANTYTINNVGFVNAGKYSVHASANSNGNGNTANTNAYPMELRIYASVTFVNDETTYNEQKIYEGGLVEKPADPEKDGYAFTGWLLNGTAFDFDSPITANISLTAGWVKTYAVTYDANGGTNAPVDSTNYTSGTTATLLGAGEMVREGYTFSGWQSGFNFYKEGDKITVTKDITLNAMWTKEIAVTPVTYYKVTYDANKAKGDVPVDNMNYTSGTTATILGQGTLNIQGFSFVGWNTAANGKGISYEVGESISVNANVTLFAQWKQDIYHITYDANGGMNAPVDTMDYYGMVFGQAAGQDSMSRKGYSFADWNTQADGNGNSYKAGAWVSATGSVTLYAQWTANTYMVTFDYKGATGDVESKEVTFDGEYGELPVPTRDVYVFKGWSLDGTVKPTSAVTADTTVSTDGDHTLYALWATDVSKAFNITYDANGADGTAPVDSMDYVGMVFGQAAGQGELSKKGYSFAGWNTQADGNGIAYKTGGWVSANGSVTLYAQWTANTYMVTFDYKGATGDVESKEVTFDGEYGELPIPTRDGYVFKGWSLDGTVKLASAVTKDMTVSTDGDHTLYALWATDVSKAFNITYDANGADGTAPVDSMDYVGMVFGQAAGQGELSKKGYSFAGWNTQAGGNGTAYKTGDWVSANGSVTLYAQWETDAVNTQDEKDRGKPEKDKTIKVKEVSQGNGRADINFDIRSANGKGYKVYVSETSNGKYKEANVSFNSKGANIKGLTNGKTYYAYIEYENGDDIEKSEIITLKPGK